MATKKSLSNDPWKYSQYFSNKLVLLPTTTLIAIHHVREQRLGLPPLKVIHNTSPTLVLRVYLSVIHCFSPIHHRLWGSCVVRFVVAGVTSTCNEMSK